MKEFGQKLARRHINLGDMILEEKVKPSFLHSQTLSSSVISYIGVPLHKEYTEAIDTE